VSVAPVRFEILFAIAEQSIVSTASGKCGLGCSHGAVEIIAIFIVFVSLSTSFQVNSSRMTGLPIGAIMRALLLMLAIQAFKFSL
jgi:hypothetical protein